MKKVILICLLFIGCKSNKENSEAKIKDFMNKEYVPSMNDPKSYEFVSVYFDTIKGERYDLIKRMEYLNADNLEANDSIKAHPSKSDSIYYYTATATFRGKNAMGALILGEQKIKYSTLEKMEMVSK